MCKVGKKMFQIIRLIFSKKKVKIYIFFSPLKLDSLSLWICHDVLFLTPFVMSVIATLEQILHIFLCLTPIFLNDGLLMTDWQSWLPVPKPRAYFCGISEVRPAHHDSINMPSPG